MIKFQERMVKLHNEAIPHTTRSRKEIEGTEGGRQFKHFLAPKQLSGGPYSPNLGGRNPGSIRSEGGRVGEGKRKFQVLDKEKRLFL